ncbi:MAG: hypothetical protein AAGD32_09280 [Planctomycetota bacterium]
MSDKVEVFCPACNRSFKVPPSKLGKSAKCPCGEMFKLELPAPPDDDDMYAFAEDDDDIPALSSPPPPPVAPAAPVAAPRAAAPRAKKKGGKGGGNKIGGYDASGAVGIGLTGKRHVEHDEPPALAKGALIAAVLTAGTVGLWYAIKASLPPGSPIPVGAMALAVGLLAGLGMAFGAVRGNNNTAFVATLIALVGMATAKFLITTVIILPNADERQAAIVEQEFGEQVKVEDMKMDWRREDVVEQMTIEMFGSFEEYLYAGPDQVDGRRRHSRKQAMNITDEELEALEDRRDLRVAQQIILDAAMARQQEEAPSFRDRVIKIYEKRAQEELDAMTDEQVLEATREEREQERFDDLVRLHAEAKLVEAGGDPEAYDNSTYEQLTALTEDAKVELAALTGEEQFDLYDKYRSAVYDVEIEAEVESLQRNNKVEELAATSMTVGEIFSCADFVFLPLGLAAAFGFGVTGRFWGTG